MKRWQDPPIEIYRGKRPYYYIRPYLRRPENDFKSVQETIRLGYLDEITESKAKHRKQQILAGVNGGNLFLQAQIPFSELVEKYRKSRMPEKANTRAKYETHLKNHILPVFGKAQLADIDKPSIEAWLMREAGGHQHGDKEYGGLSYHTRQDLKNIMSAVFTAAKDWKLWQGDSPLGGVRLGRRSEARKKRLPKAPNLTKWLAAIPETCILPADHARTAALTAIASGMRVSEVLGLEPDDIDPFEQTVDIDRGWCRGDHGPTKTKKRANGSVTSGR